MASTTLFAPSVRVVQPAFQYKKDLAYVYFTLNYNTKEEIKWVKYTLIDPNKSAIDGTNSMIKDSFCIIEKFDPKGQWVSSESAIEPNATGYIPDTGECFVCGYDLNKYKDFTINQFYQIQIYLSNSNETNITAEDASWSLPSSVSLIRPIAPIDASSVSIDEQKLRGQIQSTEDTSGIETIARYKYIIKQENTVIYSSSWLTNFLGLRFETTIPFIFQEGATYDISVQYETKHGYQGQISNFRHTVSSFNDSGENINVQSNINLDAGSLDFELIVPKSLVNHTIVIQRADEFTDYKKWVSVASIDLTNADLTHSLSWSDSYVQARTKYKYRIISDNKKYLFKETKNNDTIEIFVVDYDDIFLCDNDAMLAIRYNPKISNYKWVTQDSITNTLGGTYPIVRRNGQQFYRQFTLSGTLYFDYKSAPIENCSFTQIDMHQFFKEEENSLYLSQNKAAEYAADISKRRVLEKRMRELAISFLSNGSVKLFRSGEEDTMIVYLSGVSFTPNVTSGRHIYDFSATVTEICEATEENLVRYGFGNTINIEYVWQYVLFGNETEANTNLPGAFKVYVNISEVLGLGTDNTTTGTLKLHAKSVVNPNN